MKKRKNWYAIHFIDDQKKDVIVSDWGDAQNIMKGHNNMFKGFMTREEADKWLLDISVNDEQRHNKFVKEIKGRKRLPKTKTYIIKLPEDVAKVLDEKLGELHITAGELFEDFVRTDFCQGD